MEREPIILYSVVGGELFSLWRENKKDRRAKKLLAPTMMMFESFVARSLVMHDAAMVNGVL